MPPASWTAWAATRSAISWSGSVARTEAGMMPKAVTSMSARSSTKPPHAAVDAVGAGLGVRGVVVGVPAGSRDLGDRVDAVDEVVPVRVEVGRAGEERRHADDGDRAGTCHPGRHHPEAV